MPVEQPLGNRVTFTIRSHRYTTPSLPRMVRDRYGRPWMRLARMKNSALEGKRSDHNPQRREESSEKDLLSRRGPRGLLPIAPAVHHPLPRRIGDFHNVCLRNSRFVGTVGQPAAIGGI